MTCNKCGIKINSMNHHYVPNKNKKGGQRLCISCMKEEQIVTLI